MASRTPRGGRRPLQPRWLPFMRVVWLPVVTLLAGYSLFHMHRLLENSRARNGDRSSDNWPWNGTPQQGPRAEEEAPETGPGRPRTLGSKPRIALITNAVTYPFSEASLRSWTRYNEYFANKDCYANRHGYDLVVDYRNHVEGMGFYVDPEKTGGRGPTNVHFNKPYLLRKWLPHYDWVLWLDMDALILDMDRRVEDIVAELSDNVHVLVPQEQMTVFFFSAYALLLRGSAVAQALVEDWFALKDSCPHGLYDDQSRLYAAVLRAQLAARGVAVNQTLAGATDCLDRCEHANTTRDFSWCFDRAIKANGHKRLPAPQHGPVAFSALPSNKFKHGNDTGLALQGMFGGIRDRPDLVEHAFAIHVKPHCVRQGEKFCSPFLDAIREERYRRGMQSCYGDGWAADVLPALADPRQYADIFGGPGEFFGGVAKRADGGGGGGGGVVVADGGKLLPPDVGIAADWEALAVGILAVQSGWPGHSGKPAILPTALLLSANLSTESDALFARLNAFSAGSNPSSVELEAAVRTFQEGSRRRAEAAARARAPIPTLNPDLGVKFSQLRGRPEEMRIFARGSDSVACFAAVPGSGGAVFAATVVVPLLREYLCDVGGECVADTWEPRPEELELATSAVVTPKDTDAQKSAAAANAENEAAAQLQKQLDAAEAATEIIGINDVASQSGDLAALATDIIGINDVTSMVSAEPADGRRRREADAPAGEAAQNDNAGGVISAAAAELPKSGRGRQGGGDASFLLSLEPVGGGRSRRRGDEDRPPKSHREGGFGGWARDGKHQHQRRRLAAGTAEQLFETVGGRSAKPAETHDGEWVTEAADRRLSFAETVRFLAAANGETVKTGVTAAIALARDSAWPLRPEVVEGREALPCNVRMATALFPYNLLSAYRRDYPPRPWHFTFLRDPVDRVLISYIRAREAAAAAAAAALADPTGGDTGTKAASQWCGDTTYVRKGQPQLVWPNTTWRDFVDIVGHDEIITKFLSGVGWSSRKASDSCVGYSVPAKYPPGNFKTYSHFQANGAVGKLLEYEYFGIFAQWERSIRLLRTTLSGGGAWKTEPPPAGRKPLGFPTAADNLLLELGSAEAVAEFVGRRLDPEVRAYVLARNPKDALVYERAVNEFERRCRYFGL